MADQFPRNRKNGHHHHGNHTIVCPNLQYRQLMYLSNSYFHCNEQHRKMYWLKTLSANVWFIIQEYVSIPSLIND